MSNRSRIPHAVIALVAALATLMFALPAHSAIHVVKAGDTVKSIAALTGVTPAQIVVANRLPNADVLSIGQRLVIPRAHAAHPTPSTAGAPASTPAPSGRTVVVRPGDSLNAIAARLGVSARALAAANGMRLDEILAVGRRLRVPARAGGSATPPPVATPAPTGGAYIVRSGDTLKSIAARFGTSARALAIANGLRNGDLLVIGQRLRVPGRRRNVAAPRPATPRPATPAPAGGAVYVVRAGDTLDAIARRVGSSVAALAAANRITRPDLLTIGQRLRVPAPAAVVVTPSPAQPTSPQVPVTPATSGWGAHPSRARIAQLLNQSAARYGVDATLVRAVAWQESGWWQGARSSAGAMGVMQLMPATAGWLGPALVGRPIDATDARDNIDGGTAYLAWLLRSTPTRDLAVGAYYQGLGSVRANGLFGETKDYVAAVYRHLGR